MLAKYSPEGAKIWEKTYENNGAYARWGNAVALDSQGNIYLIGTRAESQWTNASKGLVGKYDNEGNQIWLKYFSGDVNSGENGGKDIVFHNDGTLFVTGFKEFAGQMANIWIARLNKDSGDALCEQGYNNAFANQNDVGLGLASDNNGNLYVVGIEGFKPNTDLTMIWLRKYIGF